MSHYNYNVGYYDDRGRLCLAYATSVPTEDQALKRLARVEKSGGAKYWAKDGINLAKAAPFLVHQLVGDWEKVEASDDD